MRRLMLLALALVAGCERLDRVAMGFAGSETVTLSPQPFELDAQGKTFASKDQMKARGISLACVVLKTHYPTAPQAQMDRDFEALLQGVDVSATLTAENGQEYYLESPMQAWALDGAVSSSPELSACVSSAGNAEAPVGTVIKSVHIKSDKPLPVLGVYWQSMPKLGGPKG